MVSSSQSPMRLRCSTTLLVGIDVPIDPFVTGQAGATGNLLWTEILAQQDLDLGHALSVDAWTLACLRAPMLADALRVIWQILPSELVAAQFAADRAGRAPTHWRWPASTCRFHITHANGIVLAGPGDWMTWATSLGCDVLSVDTPPLHPATRVGRKTGRVSNRRSARGRAPIHPDRRCDIAALDAVPAYYPSDHYTLGQANNYGPMRAAHETLHAAEKP